MRSSFLLSTKTRKICGPFLYWRSAALGSPLFVPKPLDEEE
jgi:hypothetical protein